MSVNYHHRHRQRHRIVSRIAPLTYIGVTVNKEGSVRIWMLLFCSQLTSLSEMQAADPLTGVNVTMQCAIDWCSY